MPSYAKDDLVFNSNEDHNLELLRKLNGKLQKIAQGGGERSIAKHKARGKMTARERIQTLLDDKEAFLEIGQYFQARKKFFIQIGLIDNHLCNRFHAGFSLTKTYSVSSPSAFFFAELQTETHNLEGIRRYNNSTSSSVRGSILW